ncbi:MAG TPA: hypothetical protein VF230_08585, partial [Acidimicrobiales bacterium]
MATVTTPVRTAVTRRVLKGYGPLALASILFLLMAIFVPTVGQEQTTTDLDSTGTSGTSGTNEFTEETVPGDTSGTTAPGTPGAPSGAPGAPGAQQQGAGARTGTNTQKGAVASNA